MPDDQRYGIFWMGQKALAAAFDMEGGFNDVVLALSPGASSEEVIARLDRILEPYGGLGAIPRALQLSHWTVQNELSQLQSFGFLLPSIFLLVAAFILNVALTRALALQRPQIASLKALGYGNVAIGWHYLKWGFAIGAGGIVIGVVAGRILRLDGHRPLQRLLPISRAELRRATECCHRLCRVDIFAAGAGAFGAVMRAVQASHPPKRCDPKCLRDTDARCSRRPALTVSGNRRAHGISATSPVIHFGPRPPSLASPSRWPS